MLSIRPLEEAELSAVYRRVARDFPPIEYPPLRKMRQHLENGFVEGRLCARQSLEAAYAFLLSAPEVSSRLLLLYAVEPEMRGLGVGSAFLRSILEDFAACDGLYAEVEKPELAASSDERRKCLRRIAFYERLGFVRVPRLFYSIYGVDMYLYYRPLANPEPPAPSRAAAELTALYNGILAPRERFNLLTYPQ